jgi:hypothetical protein
MDEEIDFILTNASKYLSKPISFKKNWLRMR